MYHHTTLHTHLFLKIYPKFALKDGPKRLVFYGQKYIVRTVMSLSSVLFVKDTHNEHKGQFYKRQ